MFAVVDGEEVGGTIWEKKISGIVTVGVQISQDVVADDTKTGGSNRGLWSDEVCNGGSWSDEVCNGGSWKDEVCNGGSWSEEVCNGGSWRDEVCNGGSWSDEVCIGGLWSDEVCIGGVGGLIMVENGGL